MAGKITLADYIVNQMAAWGIDYVFGIPGDSVLPVLESLRQQRKPRFIVTRHEGSAGLMASAWAKLSGRPAACLTDAGPGGIQLLNGVYDAHMDRVPLLALTGEVTTDHIGTHWPQDADLGTVYADATVFNHTLCDVQQAPEILKSALRACMVKSGPARLGLPKNLLRESPPEPRVEHPPDYLTSTPAGSRRDYDAAAHYLSRSPVLFVGRGSRGAEREILRLAEHLNAAIVHTLPSIGVIPHDHRLNLGVIGEAGTPAAARVLGEADVILVIGATWWQPDFVPAGTKIIQIDRERQHIGMVFPVDIAVAARAEDAIPEILRKVKQNKRDSWLALIKAARGEWEKEQQEAISTTDYPISPARVMGAVAEAVDSNSVITIDVGDNTFWFSRYFRASNQTVLVSGHWRTVGFALPAAIAAQLYHENRQVVAIAGDGGVGMTLAEFTTAVKYELPIKVIVLCNDCYGEEKHLQDMAGVTPFGTDFTNPDFALFAESAGGMGIRVEEPGELADGLRRALRNRQPTIVQVKVADELPPRPTPLAWRSEHAAAVSEHVDQAGDGQRQPALAGNRERRPKLRL